MKPLVHYNDVGLQLSYMTPGFEEALYHFREKRMDFYKKYQNEMCFDTYEESGFADSFHSTSNPPIFFVSSPDLHDSVMRNRDGFSYMVTMFDLKRHIFTYKNSEKQDSELLFSSQATKDRPFIGFSLGSSHQHLTFRAQSDYNRRLVYYLLPEDYHYFKDFLPFYVNFQSTKAPSLLL